MRESLTEFHTFTHILKGCFWTLEVTVGEWFFDVKKSSWIDVFFDISRIRPKDPLLTEKIQWKIPSSRWYHWIFQSRLPFDQPFHKNTVNRCSFDLRQTHKQITAFFHNTLLTVEGIKCYLTSSIKVCVVGILTTSTIQSLFEMYPTAA